MKRTFVPNTDLAVMAWTDCRFECELQTFKYCTVLAVLVA